MGRNPAPLLTVTTLLCFASATAALAQAPETGAAVEWERLQRYAHLAKLAYAPDSALRAAYPGVRIDTRDLPSVHGRLVVLTDDHLKAQWVAARGTKNIENVLLDADYRTGLDAKASVRLHRGFDEYASVAYDSLRPLLRRGYSLNLTGHSLGAAAAVILMMYLHADGQHVSEVVTFGQPKVTDSLGAARYAAFPVTRVVDCRDPIPLTPPHGLPSGRHGTFRHFGREIILLDGPLHIVLAEHAAERQDVSSFWRRLPHIEAHDHRMDSYLARIATKLRGARRMLYRPGATYACSPTR